MFLVILPLSVSDSHLVDGWVTVFRALKGGMKCHFVLVPTPMMRTKAKYAAAAMQGFCASVEVRSLETEPQGDFPRASNEHFKGAMFVRSKLDKARKALPFIWMELDALPIIEGWDTKLHHEYALECNGAGWLGTLVPMVKDVKKIPRETPHKDIPDLLKKTKGTLIIDEEDLYMEGVGIYPANFDALTERQWMFTRGAAFDQKLAPYAKRNWHNTDQIQSRWRTGNYTIDSESGEVTGEDLPSNPHGTVHAGPIHASTVLFHGCKDTSLQQIIAESRGMEIRQVEEMVEVPVVKVAQVTKAVSEGSSKKANIPKAFRITPKAKPNTQAGANDDTLTVEDVLAKLAENPSNRRLDQWAADLNVSQETLKELVQNSEGRLKLTGVAHWLKAAA